MNNKDLRTAGIVTGVWAGIVSLLVVWAFALNELSKKYVQAKVEKIDDYTECSTQRTDYYVESIETSAVNKNAITANLSGMYIHFDKASASASAIREAFKTNQPVEIKRCKTWADKEHKDFKDIETSVALKR